MSWAEDEGIDFYDEDWAREMRTLELQIDPDNFREYWMTKAGEQIYIEDMKTSHINNILKGWSEDRFVLDKSTVNRLVLELSIRRRLHERDINELKNLPF